MAKLFWTPKDHRIGDITIIRVGDEYHLFTEQSPLDWGGELGENFAGIRGVGHAVSKDMFEWKELPPTISCGPAGSFDGYSIYHMDVFIHEGTWYMFYTGLDKGGPGEQQSIGLATSRDGIKWEKHPANPILRADPRWYEEAVPREATYQSKDFGRLWFRDPCIIRDPETGRFGMIVIARDKSKPVDTRACLAWASSDDLVHWTPHPPIYSPGRFHTVETPSIFQRNGRHYIVYMSGSYWGTPLLMSDPYQNTGNFYAISTSGWTGPYETPADEVLAAGCDQMRMGAARTVEGPDGEHYYYGWLFMNSQGDDIERPGKHVMCVPPPRRVKFVDDGQMQLTWHEGLERFADQTTLPATPALPPESFRTAAGGVIGKNFLGAAAAMFPGEYGDVIFSARVRFLHGERAGLIVRGGDDGKTGWHCVVDRRMKRVEFGLLGSKAFIDARAWQPADECTIKVVANQMSLEVYVDDRLYIHQVRHREIAGQVGYYVDHAEVRFDQPVLRVFRS